MLAREVLALLGAREARKNVSKQSLPLSERIAPYTSKSQRGAVSGLAGTLLVH